MSPGRLEGKVAIITGASTGLGPVMASIFVREGAKVLLSARREELVLAAAAAAGEGAIGMRADVTIDVTASMLCTREVLRQSMLERRSGVILNFSSTAGFQGMVRKSHYVTAKASLRAFTKAVALEVGEYGIRCNCIVPGGIDTELWQGWVRRMADEKGADVETYRASLLSGVALRDISSPEDIANAALFLVSDESRTITGQSIPVDAGGYMQG